MHQGWRRRRGGVRATRPASCLLPHGGSGTHRQGSRSSPERHAWREAVDMNVAVVGTGYVGLVTGAVFADLGNDVVCVDKDAAKIAGAPGRADADLRAGPRGAGRPQRRRRPARRSPPTWPTPCAGRTSSSSPSALRPRPPASPTCTAVEEVAHGIAEALDRLQGHRQQVHGAGGHRRPGAEHHRAQPAPAGQLRRRLEPRVPARGLGHRGHAPPRPDRRRRAQPAGGDDAARALRARSSGR